MARSSRVQRHGPVPVPGRRGALRPAEVVVGDDQLSEWAAGGNMRKCHGHAACAHQEHAQGADHRPLARPADETSRDI